MGAFPEPALCADDVRGAAPETPPVAWPGRDLRRLDRVSAAGPRRTGGAARTLALRLTVGLTLGAALPQAALAPAASAHDRAPGMAEAAGLGGVASALAAKTWNGVSLPVESPATTALIADDLAELASPSGTSGLDLAGALNDPALEVRAPTETLRFDRVAIPRWLVETILRAASETGVDPVYLMALADKESSFLPEAKAATSSAEGLFQFLNQTWLELVRDFGPRHGLAAESTAIEARGGQLSIADAEVRERVLALRRDPYTAAVMAGEMMKRDRARVEQRLGRELKRSECYLAHFFGAASAGRFMALADGKPKQSAAAAFRSAAQANRSLFFARNGKKLRGLTVAEVYARLDDMIDRRLDRFRTVSGAARPIEAGGPVARIESALALLR